MLWAQRGVFLKKSVERTQKDTYISENSRFCNLITTENVLSQLEKGKLPNTTAVIASCNAATTYKLKILDESIQDLKFNYTVFIAAERLEPAMSRLFSQKVA